MSALAIGGLVANVAGTVFQGFQQKQAAEEEAEDIRQQAQIQRDEADEEARRLDIKNRKFLAKQSLMFVKSGVTLSGSPMLVLQETREESAKESAAVSKRGIAQFELGQKKAARLEKAGRGAFIGSLFKGFGSAATGGFELKRLGVFG